MEVSIHPSWKEHLSTEFQKDYFLNLVGFVKNAYLSQRCYPSKKQIFAAFDSCPFENLRVVIIGQDPYHGFGQANGLCFSVNDGVRFPPSLNNIFKEIEQDLSLSFPISGNLERWAKQGVLLLNATLTVQESLPGSHQNQGWEQFTDAVIDLISAKKETVVFLLWGGFAKLKGKTVNRTKHLVLESGHPSPMSANKGHWFGNKHFSKTNAYLKEQGLKEIDW
jgi:uracil-DNA glycosylase